MYRLASLHVLIAGVLVSATCVFAAIPNLALNPGFSEASTEPGQVAAAWSYTFPDAVSPRAVVSLSTTSGLPAPSLRITSAALAAGGSTTDNGAFQVFPVVPGTKYQVSGQWRGNLSVQPPGGGNHRSTVFCTIEFSADGLTGWTAYGGASRYLKQLDYARIRASTNVPFTMTLQDYTWDWEDITLSPQTGFPAAFDVLAVPAGMNFMRVRFALTTLTQPDFPASWVEIDNVVVTSCQGALAGDLNDDCQVNVIDLARVVNTWLGCGISPGGSALCW